MNLLEEVKRIDERVNSHPIVRKWKAPIAFFTAENAYPSTVITMEV